jgi:hypothetical protein
VAAKAIGADISSREKNLNLNILSAVNSIEAALQMFEASAKENSDPAIVPFACLAAGLNSSCSKWSNNYLKEKE